MNGKRRNSFISFLVDSVVSQHSIFNFESDYIEICRWFRFFTSFESSQLDSVWSFSISYQIRFLLAFLFDSVDLANIRKSRIDRQFEIYYDLNTTTQKWSNKPQSSSNYVPLSSTSPFHFFMFFAFLRLFFIVRFDRCWIFCWRFNHKSLSDIARLSSA